MAWIFRSQINYMFGLSAEEGDIVITDHMIAVLATILLFITPVDPRDDQFVLTWRDTERLPWGILLLFGGGLSLAAALDYVGLIDLIGQQFEGWQCHRFLGDRRPDHRQPIPDGDHVERSLGDGLPAGSRRRRLRP